MDRALALDVPDNLTLRVLGGSHREKSRWTSENVKLLLPPRQSRGNSHCIRHYKLHVVILVVHEFANPQAFEPPVRLGSFHRHAPLTPRLRRICSAGVVASFTIRPDKL